GAHTQRVDKLLSLADKQLYAAKNSGRNQVKCEPPDVPQQEQASLL
ncbi:MAG: diguanylate cyclase response regulator, partial [Alteromonas sp.]|nr:diguanylate cyclase response regulator [Alteromonas sp.]